MCIIDEYDPRLQESIFKFVVIEFKDKDKETLEKNIIKAAKYGIPIMAVKNREDCFLARIFLADLLKKDGMDIVIHGKEELPRLTGIPLPTEFTSVPHIAVF